MDAAEAALVGVLEREDAIQEALEAVLSGVNAAIDRSEAQRRACQQAARECLALTLDLVDLVYPQRQRAPITAVSAVNGSWEADPEPVPCHVERWNRGFLTVSVREWPRCEAVSRHRSRTALKLKSAVGGRGGGGAAAAAGQVADAWALSGVIGG